ncbi:MAG: type II secretion system F family protein [Aeromicrobium sp.]
MGGLIGLMMGIGLVFIGWTYVEPGWRLRRRGAKSHRVVDLLARAGLSEISPKSLLGVCTACFLFVTAMMAALSGVLVVAIVFGLMASLLPIAILRGRATRRTQEFAALWPDAVDNLASAVRAGLSLPEALQQLGERGPEGLRPPFLAFARDYQSTGRFHESLDRLKVRLADPVGDRVVEALRIARDVGGGDLGRMLRALSGFLRDDARTRGELESRQSWTVNGARLAVAAPWIVLLLMSLQRDVVARFSTGAGLVILCGGAIVCVVAYRLMMWIGRFPAERRILA